MAFIASAENRSKALDSSVILELDDDLGEIRLRFKGIKVLPWRRLKDKVVAIKMADVKHVRYENRFDFQVAMGLYSDMSGQNGIYFYDREVRDGDEWEKSVCIDPIRLLDPEVRAFLDKHVPFSANTHNLLRERNWRFAPAQKSIFGDGEDKMKTNDGNFQVSWDDNDHPYLSPESAVMVDSNRATVREV